MTSHANTPILLASCYVTVLPLEYPLLLYSSNFASNSSASSLCATPASSRGRSVLLRMPIKVLNCSSVHLRSQIIRLLIRAPWQSGGRMCSKSGAELGGRIPAAFRAGWRSSKLRNLAILSLQLWKVAETALVLAGSVVSQVSAVVSASSVVSPAESSALAQPCLKQYSRSYHNLSVSQCIPKAFLY